MNRQIPLRLLNSFVKIHNQFSAVKRNAICTIQGEKFYPAEMHILTLLYESPETSISGIAERLYITRSAASQMVKKLNRKGLIIKTRRPENEREVLLTLSETGKEAVVYFLESESEALSGFMNEFSQMDESQIETLKSVLSRLEIMFDKKLE